MTTNYPGALDTFTTKVDGIDDVMAAHVNELQTDVVAIETELGTLPKGSYADVKTRLDNMIADNPPALDDLTDINAPTPADKDVLAWDSGAGEWINSPEFYHAFNDVLPSVKDQMMNSNTFLEDDTNQLGFTVDTTASADSYTPSGVWSKANTGAVWFYVASHVLMVNSLGAGPSILKWTDATALNYCEIQGQPMAPTPATPYGGEFRFWAVQSPGAADKYWAVRFLYDAATYPQWPFRVQIFSGTGVTFAIADGTMRNDYPWDTTRGGVMQMRIYTGPTCQVKYRTFQAAIQPVILTATLAAHLTDFKTMWAYVPGTFLAMALDSIRVY